jgi:uncharacterized membrane protein
MSIGMGILLAINALSILFTIVLVLEYEHVRGKYNAFLGAMEHDQGSQVMRRSSLVYVYVIVALFFSIVTITLFAIQPHLL